MVKLMRDEINKHIPVKFDVYQNYPNPFIEKTKINYSLPKTSKVRFMIIDESGRIVHKSISDEQDAGFYEVEFIPENLSRGIYFYLFITCENFTSMKMDFIK